MNQSIYLLVCIVAVVSGKYTGSTNQAGINIIKEFEGFHPNFYNDSVGHHFIGYGHVCREAASCITPIFGKYDVPLNHESAEALLKEDLGSQGGSEACVSNAISYSRLNQNQFSALVSFVQNMGCRTFRNSYLRNKVNRGHIKAAEHEFGRHVYVIGGRRNDKLVRRRNAERALFAGEKQRQPTKTFRIVMTPVGEKCTEGYERIRVSSLIGDNYCAKITYTYEHTKDLVIFE